VSERPGSDRRFVDDMAPKRLSKDVRIVRFRAVRELFTHVAKHARARQDRVTRHREGASIRIVVEDDGRGFDPEALSPPDGGPGGFGLFNMRERLDLLGERMTLRSRAGTGARVTPRAPLAPGSRECRGGGPC